jgi:hypothetical protein
MAGRRLMSGTMTGMTANWNYSPEAARDAERDVLAILAARLRDDDEGCRAVLRNANPAALLPVTLDILVQVLEGDGVDLAEWIAGHQLRLAEAPGPG